MNLNPQSITDLLIKLREHDLWRSDRTLFHKKSDIQPFISSNILAILNHCQIADQRLKWAMIETEVAIRKFQKEHLTYHWPLIGEKARIANSTILNKLKFLSISPDADCSCLQQIVLNDKQNIIKLLDELIYYRLDNRKYILPGFQRNLPCTEGTFLTWFSQKEPDESSKVESIDIVVDSNILWFLGKTQHLHIPGVNETIQFIRKILNTELIMTKPLYLSPYYPFSAGILYYISRAIHWGNINELMDCKKRIIELANTITPENDLNRLFLALVGNYWNEKSLITQNWPIKDENASAETIYIGSLIMPLALRLPVFSVLMKFRIFNIEFSSLSFQYALMLWLLQTASI